MIACLISASLFEAFLFWPQVIPSASASTATRVNRIIVEIFYRFFRV
jgi:hypothetical protein